MKNEVLFKFASIAEAVGYLYSHGYKTILESAGPSKVRLMRSPIGDIAIIRRASLLEVVVEDDDGYWYDKLQDWASEAADYFPEYD